MTDTILFNGRITTLDPAHPSATAVAIEKGLFTAATAAMSLGAAVGAFLVLRIGVAAALALTFALLALNAVAAYRVWLRSAP